MVVGLFHDLMQSPNVYLCDTKFLWSTNVTWSQILQKDYTLMADSLEISEIHLPPVFSSLGKLNCLYLPQKRILSKNLEFKKLISNKRPLI